MAGAEPNGEWQLPLASERLASMRAALDQHAASASDGEALLSNAFAWMRKASEDKLEGACARVHVCVCLCICVCVCACARVHASACV